MDLPLRRGRTPVLLLALALALVGCGGVPKGPILPGEAPRAPVPEDSQARAASLTRLGDTALRSGDTEAAVSLFEQATLTDGGNAAPAVGLGNALLAAGRDLDATRAFERALAIQPSLPEARYGYARSMIAIYRRIVVWNFPECPPLSVIASEQRYGRLPFVHDFL
jgi:tetratricopeptide (TPR) repeat protein